MAKKKEANQFSVLPNVEVETVTVRVGKKRHMFTYQEARDLEAALDALFSYPPQTPKWSISSSPNQWLYGNETTTNFNSDNVTLTGNS